MTNSLIYTQTLPQKRMAAGALFFDNANHLLIVKPTYRNVWLIPGGSVEVGESPRQACVREVKEELGFACQLQRLLCIDYTSATKHATESLQFAFLGGTLTATQITQITLPPDELATFRFVPTDEAIQLLGPRLSRRLPHCLRAIAENSTLYLEDQQHPFA